MSEQRREGDPPEQLGRYELLTRVGAGDVAEVFVARVRGQERLVAVKRIRETIAEQEHFAERFLDQGRIARLVDSPHVVQIDEVGRAASGAPFVAMELVRGVSLHRLLSLLGEHPIPVSIAVAILVQAAEGLGAAHRATTRAPLGVVHGQVSPQNLLVGIDGRVRVTGFGLAPVSATAQSDVFALGVVAWETLAMRRLSGDTTDRIHDLVPLDEVRPEIPAELARAIDRALGKDPGSRTESALRFAADLRAACEPADGPTLSGFAKTWMDGDVQDLEARIRAALRLDAASEGMVERSGVRHVDEAAPLTVQSEPWAKPRGAKMGMPPPAPLAPISVVVPMLAPPPVIAHGPVSFSVSAPAPVSRPMATSRMPLYLLSFVIAVLLGGSLMTLWNRRNAAGPEPREGEVAPPEVARPEVAEE